MEDLKSRPVAEQTAAANEQHYEVLHLFRAPPSCVAYAPQAHMCVAETVLLDARLQSRNAVSFLLCTRQVAQFERLASGSCSIWAGTDRILPDVPGEAAQVQQLPVPVANVDIG